MSVMLCLWLVFVHERLCGGGGSAAGDELGDTEPGLSQGCEAVAALGLFPLGAGVWGPVAALQGLGWMGRVWISHLSGPGEDVLPRWDLQPRRGRGLRSAGVWWVPVLCAAETWGDG